jgi:hypothetical protein
VYVLFTHVYPDDTVVGSAYRYRDDGLVTLSHARGLADVGTVSVSISGSRVEGYSTPLQFAAASAFYGLGGDGYRGPPTPSSSAQAADHLRCVSERRSATLR